MGAAVSEEDSVIAVVDDSEVVREALDQLLVSVGYRTELYASAEEFMRAATATRAACLVIDVELGGTTGPQLLRDLAAQGRRFPAVLMSGCGDPALPRVATELGCLTFLTKPFAPNDLLEVIARAIVFGCS
jgi:FixJ family two-component response regulator